MPKQGYSERLQWLTMEYVRSDAVAMLIATGRETISALAPNYHCRTLQAWQATNALIVPILREAIKAAITITAGSSNVF